MSLPEAVGAPAGCHGARLADQRVATRPRGPLAHCVRGDQAPKDGADTSRSLRHRWVIPRAMLSCLFLLGSLRPEATARKLRS